MMPAFELFQPSSVDEAIGVLRRYDKESWVLAGGLDSLEWLKNRVEWPKAPYPRAMVSLEGIEELRGIRSGPDGLEIGAMTTLSELAEHPEVVDRYGVLASAAGQVASPQIRNQGTLGGNIAQDSRCWYYRGGFDCYRAGGNTCYADTPTAMNHDHCLLGADRCITVNSSDVAPALIALDARVVIRGPGGEDVVPIERFYIGPGTDITRMNVLEPGMVITRVQVPGAWSGTRSYFEKARHRQSWDFGAVNVAAVARLSGGIIEGIRLAVNGVAPTPLRLTAVEEAVTGSPPDEETATIAGETAIWGARPVHYSDYKVTLLRNLVRRAIRGVAV
ncbi:molybdopterin dehydrogenase [Limnochorda pilosa]|uniref:Molybdopterin dehydrogenase n=2 Tax=Limnochorda pilosa TaxID=1555112 RepID=A0A0K2SP18_LIMPI|nr:molybdopterin dehydrogenase [Limnochorda pilosa]